MTTVTFLTDKQGIHGFKAKGHTGFAARGEDIVCAAISALTQAAVIGLQEVVRVECQIEIKKAHLICTLPPELSAGQWEKSQIILLTLYKGLESVRNEYGDYLRLREVQPS